MSLGDEEFAAVMFIVHRTIAQAMQFVEKGKASIQDDDFAEYDMVRMYHFECMSIGVKIHAVTEGVLMDMDNAH